jgi:hypothetical protein
MIRPHLPEGFPKIVTLCGSTRFKEEFEKTNREEGLKGHIVLSVSSFVRLEGVNQDGEVKKALDQLHLKKIDLADEVLVLNPRVLVCLQCGNPSRFYTELSQETQCCRTKRWVERVYVGESTRREIEYARANGKVVRFLEPME